MQLTLGMYGVGDFFDLKGVVEEVLEKAGLKEKLSYNPKAGKNFLHPGRQAEISYEGVVIGYMGEIHPEVADTYEIGEKAESVLTDKEQLILVYCRSGRRSKNAASELAALGYTNIKEFGGIIDWPYGMVTE